VKIVLARFPPPPPPFPLFGSNLELWCRILVEDEDSLEKLRNAEGCGTEIFLFFKKIGTVKKDWLWLVSRSAQGCFFVLLLVRN
jgi:hypothetical protein